MHGAQVGDEPFVADLAIGCRAHPCGAVASGGEEPPDCCRKTRQMSSTPN